MDDQTFILAGIVLCSLAGWYVVVSKYLALKQMINDQDNQIPTHIPGMGPPPVSNVPFMVPEDLLPPHELPNNNITNNPSVHVTAPIDKRLVCNQACILHLLGFGIIAGVPFLNILLPTFYWLLVKEKHVFLAKQGREVINFQITFSIMQFLFLGAGILFIRYAPQSAAELFAYFKIAKLVFASGRYLPFNIFTVIPFFWCCIVMMRGAVAAYHGVTYKYPATQQFLMAPSNPPKQAVNKASPLSAQEANLNNANFS